MSGRRQRLSEWGGTKGDRYGLRISATPLISLVELHGGFTACSRALAGQRLIAFERAYHRAAETGDLTVYTADVLAITLLGLHPLLVWGEEWLDVTPQRRAQPVRRQSVA